MDYALSTDRSWSRAYPKAIQTYNAAAGMYYQVVQKRGQPLREGFTIVKVRATRCACAISYASHHLLHISRDLRLLTIRAFSA